MTALRPYQQRGIQELRTAAQAGRRRLLFVLPTGGGKTLTASAIIRSATDLGRRVLFVVHLRELVDQTVRALERVGVTDVGVMRGDDGRTNPEAAVQVASIQTLARRQMPAADIVILDEAHRSLASSYDRIFALDALVIGLTATPCRGDGQGLGRRYEQLIVGATYSELMADGFIAEPRVIAPRTPPDLGAVRKIGGDWDEGALSAVMGKLAGDIVPTWQKYAEGRTTVVFACGIDHSMDIVQRFQRAGVRAAHLDGGTPAAERTDLVARVRSGGLQVLSNCAVLTEGFDAPEIRCAIIARPTLSLILHMQTAGRALRAGAVQPLILDHADNVRRHGLPHEDRLWSLEGQQGRPKVRRDTKLCAFCYAYIPLRAEACPYCGEAVVVRERELPMEAKVEMTDVAPVDVEHAFYVDALNQCRVFGLKPGAAAHKFKDRFKRWPPWSWSQRGTVLFNEDPAWRRRVDVRARKRAASAAAQASAGEAAGSALVPTNGGQGRRSGGA